jgi:hypothetical protein
MLGLLNLAVLFADPTIVEPLSTASAPGAATLATPRAPEPSSSSWRLDGEPPHPISSLPSGILTPRRPNYLLAALETGALFVGGTIWYWDRTWYSSGPFDLHFDWASWGKKLDLSAIRFDTDRYSTSAGDHPRAGISYYQAARGNGLGFATSYLWVFGTETLWAYLVEWDELPSLNDMIMTPQSGTVVGESMFRLGQFFDAGAPTLANRIGAIIFSPIAFIDDLATGRRPAREGPLDEWGFTRTMSHRFVFALDGLVSSLDGKRASLAAFGVESDLVTAPGYERPGRGWTGVGAGERTDLAVRILASPGIQGTSFHSSTLFGGRYFRHYAGDDSGGAAIPPDLAGWGALLGLGTSFDYETRQLVPSEDKVVSSGLLGPALELEAARGPSRVRVSLAAYYSLAIIQSLAYAQYGDPSTNAVYELSTPLHEWGYYYGQGVTSFGSATARFGVIELGVTANLAAYWSINAWDRYQERLRNELSPSDTRSGAAARVALRLFHGTAQLAASVEGYRRTGELGGRTALSREGRAGVGVAFVF